MGCSAFFDHDLFHLALILNRLKTCKTDNPDIVLNSIRNLYASVSCINTVSFKALELVIFYYCHEEGFTKLNPCNGRFLPTFNDLPPEYQSITKGEVRQANEWLRQQGIPSGGSLSELLEKIKTNEDNFIPCKRAGSDDEVYQVAPEKLAWITSLIESIRNRDDQIASYGLNYRHMIDLLCKYSNKKSTSENAIDCVQLFSCADHNQKEEAKWLACYSELSSSEKTKDFETLLPIIHQHYSEYNLLYSENLEKLLSVCRNTIEDFVAEFIRQFPQMSEEHSSSLIKLTYRLEIATSVAHFMVGRVYRTYLSFLMLRGNYAHFWENHDQASQREPFPEVPFTPLGILKDGKVNIVILSESFSHKYESLKKEGYESPF